MEAGEIGIKTASRGQGGVSKVNLKRTLQMGLSAILIAAALTITMFIAVTDVA
jgi:hypothetical protein